MNPTRCNCWKFDPDETGECLTCGHDASWHREAPGDINAEVESECGFNEASA